MGTNRKKMTKMLENWQRNRRRSLPELRDLRQRNSVSSVWEPSVSWLPTLQTHLGMEVYGYDPYISVDAAWKLSREIKHISQCGRYLQRV